MNSILQEIYERKFQSLMGFKAKFFSHGLEGPLLVKVPDRYLNQKVRVVFVGQQTNGWFAGEASLDEILKIYEKFDFGRHYNASPFWNMIRKIERELGVSPYSSVWTNINRFDEKEKRPTAQIELEMRIFDDLLIEELDVLKPDIVLFFTGPSFDERLQYIFPEAEFSSLGSLPGGVLSKIKHNKLPKLSYRTHHPKSLRIRKYESNVISQIVEDAKASIYLSRR